MFGVVGDGLAGVVAARRLRGAGHEVVVFGSPEGVSDGSSGHMGGPPEAAFARPVSRSDDALVALADDLGVSVSWDESPEAFYADGAVHPLGDPWEVVAFPYFGLYDAWRWSRLGRADGAAESARARCLSRATRGVCEAVVDPLARADAGADAAAVDAAWFDSCVAGRGERGRVDVAELWNALRDGVDVRSDARAVGLAAGAGGVESLSVETAGGGRETHDVAGVVVAAGPDALESLTGYECALARREAVRATVRASDPPTSERRVVVVDDASFDLLVRRNDGRVSMHATVAPGERANADFLGALESLFPEFDPDGAGGVRTARAPSVVFGPGERGIPAAPDATPGVYYAGVASAAQRPAPSAGGAVRAGRAAAAAALAEVAR